MQWQVIGRRIELKTRALVMGILNVTPDSSTDGGNFLMPEIALAHARQMIAEGADIIDIGGESSRPGSLPVAAAEEWARVEPVIRRLRTEWDGLLSIDTKTVEVARRALQCGVDIVNDITGLRDPQMIQVCAEYRCGVVVMHMQGEPKTMQQHPHYTDVVAEVAEFFQDRLATACAAGIAPEAIVFDPGIGFGKNVEHNLALLRSLATLAVEDRPLLVGVSRKSFIGAVLGDSAVDCRSWPTVGLSAWARSAGAMIHRVHEVRENREALRMMEAILGDG